MQPGEGINVSAIQDGNWVHEQPSSKYFDGPVISPISPR